MSNVDYVEPLPSDGVARQPLIARDGLVACVDRASALRVTIISAPAGSGKTSLLRAWAGRPDPGRRLAAVQVRRDQHDAQLFWLDLLNAVRQALGTTQDEPPAATPITCSPRCWTASPRTCRLCTGAPPRGSPSTAT
jgi:LuxR family transcriptional regulator, maltose regulon positive regulatory protein